MTERVDTTETTVAEVAPFQPSEEWIDAFTKQCTEAMRLDLRAYAKRRARGVGRAGGHVDDGYVHDLVADALANTLFGIVAWDHAVSRSTSTRRTRSAAARGMGDRKRALRDQVS